MIDERMPIGVQLRYETHEYLACGQASEGIEKTLGQNGSTYVSAHPQGHRGVSQEKPIGKWDAEVIEAPPRP